MNLQAVLHAAPSSYSSASFQCNLGPKTEMQVGVKIMAHNKA